MPGRLGRRLLVVALPVALVGALAVPAIGYEWSTDDAGQEGLPPEVGIGAGVIVRRSLNGRDDF